MRVAVFDGTAEGDGVAVAVGAALDRVLAGRSWGAQRLVMRDIDIPHCLGCFECWVHTPGTCIAKGECDRLARAYIDSNLVIYLTRITFGGYSSELKKGIDHTIGLVSPFFTRVNGETHHRKRYSRYPSLLGIGLQARADHDASDIFTRLVERNAINAYAPSHRALVLAGAVKGGEVEAAIEGALSDMGGRS